MRIGIFSALRSRIGVAVHRDRQRALVLAMVWFCGCATHPGDSTAESDADSSVETSTPGDSTLADSSEDLSNHSTSSTLSTQTNDDDSTSDSEDSQSTAESSGDTDTSTFETTSTESSDESEACPAGAMLEKMASQELYSWPATVFSDAPLSGNGENHQPVKLALRVTHAGQALADCKVRWLTDAGHGWGFGAHASSDANGEVYGYWSAGEPGINRLRAVIDLEGGGTSEVEFEGTVEEHSSRTDSVHLWYDVDSSYTEFKIRITPRSAPPATYYSALNWKDSYAGIQFVDQGESMVIFSVWDAGGEKAQIVDQGACNEVVGFDGEGTGTSCRFRLPPAIHGEVAGLPDDYQLEVDSVYELHLVMASSASGGTAHSMTFTDLSRMIGPISLGTQSTGTAFTGGGHGSGFVEEWTEHGNCLSNARAVDYHDLQAKVGGVWETIKSASFSPNYVTSNNEICSNYLAEIREGHFFVSSGGSSDVGRPYVPGDDNFPKPQAKLVLP